MIVLRKYNMYEIPRKTKEQMNEVWKRAFNEGRGPEILERELPPELARKVKVVVAEDNNKVIGALMWIGTEDRDFSYFVYDLWIFVDPEWQGNGIGSSMEKFKLGELEKNYAYVLVADTTSERVVKFHERLGYKLIPYRDGGGYYFLARFKNINPSEENMALAVYKAIELNNRLRVALGLEPVRVEYHEILEKIRENKKHLILQTIPQAPSAFPRRTSA